MEYAPCVLQCAQLDANGLRQSCRGYVPHRPGKRIYWRCEVLVRQQILNVDKLPQKIDKEIAKGFESYPPTEKDKQEVRNEHQAGRQKSKTSSSVTITCVAKNAVLPVPKRIVQTSTNLIA